MSSSIKVELPQEVSLRMVTMVSEMDITKTNENTGSSSC
jgi:hypothetical protein